MNLARELLVKIWLLVGLTFLCSYIFFRLFFINYSPYLFVFSLILLLAEIHNMVQLFVMIYSLWPRKYQVYNKSLNDRNAALNIFICVCGEPRDVVRDTIIAAKRAVEEYVAEVKPIKKPKIVVLNDGFAAKKSNWKDIEKLARDLGVDHLRREKNKGFKAGNINNGLSKNPTKNPFNTFDIVLDADFAVVPTFLLEITKPFVSKEIDFVQTPQRYRKQNTWIAQASAAHQVHFFTHVCPAKANDNALFLCGTNFAVRRSALDEVGRMDERFITEDYATSLNLHLVGKVGAFIKKPLAYGIAPSSMKAYFSQQRRWSKGTFDTSIVYFKRILFGPLTKKQKFQYIVSSIYYLSGLRNLIFILAPLPYLVFGQSLMGKSFFDFITYVYTPLFIYNFIVYFALFDHPLKSWVLDTITFPVYISSFFGSILKKRLDFIVTIKSHEKENIFKVYKMQLILIAVLFNALAYGVFSHRAAESLGEYINFFWVFFNTLVLSLGFYLYLKDNYLDELDEVSSKNIKIKPSFFIPVLERLVIIPLIVILFLGVALQNPNFKNTFKNTTSQVSASVGESNYDLLLTPKEGVYYGYYQSSFNNHSVNTQFSPVNEEKPSLLMYYQDWSTENSFDINFMNQISEKNVIPVVTWEPWDGSKVKNDNYIQPDYIPKLIAEGKYDNYVRDWARAAKAYNKPFFLRFAHEMNGNWYAWGDVGANQPKDYVAMWRHVHDIFVIEGATNVIWVWAPNNQDSRGNMDSAMSYYPGDRYVDWVGFSGFNWGDTDTFSWVTFNDLSSEAYEILSKTGKPIMAAETSTVGSDHQKAIWIKGLTQSLPNMPQLKAVIFYSAQFKNVDFNLSTDKTTQSLRENVEGNSYFLKYPILQTVKVPSRLSSLLSR